MILAAGLTPAWQQIMVFDSFRAGEVNRAREVHWLASGKVFNAAVAAHHLGGPVLALATVGGPPQAEIEREFRETGVPFRWVVTRSATRVCTTIVDSATGAITELVENGRPVTREELDQFRSAYAEEAAKADVAVVIGSLPDGVPDGFYRELMERTPCPAVLDFRGPGLLGVLDLKPLVVKPNREELARTVGRSLETDADLVAAMRTLCDRGAGWVVITQGAGPVWVASATEVYRLRPLSAEKVVNPIGCGDAMAAAIAWAVRSGSGVIDAVRLGVAASADNLRQLLTCRLDPAWIARQAERVVVEAMQ